MRLAGVALALLGIAGSMASQIAMGASWRADVDPDVRTELVTTGPFRVVRNPVLTATATTIVGLALMVPNVLGVTMMVLSLASMQIQVRLVEEPYLERLHATPTDTTRGTAASCPAWPPWCLRAIARDRA